MLKKCFIAIFLVLGVISCGGGGGGGDENTSGDQQPADVNISADPTAIDSGDRITIRVRVSSFARPSIALKIRFPRQLKYVKSSSYLTVNDADARFDPTNSQTSGDSSYLVFYVSTADLNDNDEGIVSFELVGQSLVEDGIVEVDADIDDPDISNSSEFKVTDPQFEPQDGVTVQVRGEPEATPTVVPTAGATAAATATPKV